MYCAYWCDLDLKFLKFWKLHFSMSTSSAILACHSQLMGDYNSTGPSVSFSEPGFWISPTLSSHMTSKFAKCWHHRKMLISRESTAFYLRAGRGKKLVIVIAGRPQQAMHAGSDDRQPPCGAFFISNECKIFCICLHLHNKLVFVKGDMQRFFTKLM